MIVLPYPQRKVEIMAFVQKHHYNRRCPSVWTVAYGIQNAKGKLQAVLVYGPPPYPNIARAFCRRPADTGKLVWQTRMVGAGISAEQLNEAIQLANRDLLLRGYWWVLTLTDPIARVIESGLMKIVFRGFTGEVYHRNGFLFLGTTSGGRVEGYVVDGKMHHNRQGGKTLTGGNIRQYFPAAHEIREIRSMPKNRWVYVLGTPAERAQRVLLMKYHPQPWEIALQPRLFTKLTGLPVFSA